MTDARVGAEVATFLDWAEDMDPPSRRAAIRLARDKNRRATQKSAVDEQLACGVSASFTSALEKGLRPVLERARQMDHDILDFAAFKSSLHFCAEAIYQRGRLSVGSYLVLTEPFRVAGFDFEDGWGVGPGAEGVVTAAAEGGNRSDSGSDGGDGPGRGSGDGEGVS